VSTGSGRKQGDCLYWRSHLGTPKLRRYVKVSGVAPDVELQPFTESLLCLRRAVEERVFQVKGSDGLINPPRPAPGDFAKHVLPAYTALLPLLPSTVPVTHNQFVMSYSGRKQKRYREALDRIRSGGFDAKKCAEVSVFVKFEKTDWTSKSDPVPRVISPRDPRFNLKLGRYLKHLEKPLFRAIDDMFGEKTIIKGLNATESAAVLRKKWDSFVSPIAVGLDASRFDQHVSLQALEWEHEVYRNCFKSQKHRDRLSALLKHQLVNKCYGSVPDGELRYQITGTRMSGDINTSMGNCLLMCSMIYSYLSDIGVRAKLANNGDDCVLFLERRDFSKLTGLYDWFLRIGFNMAIEEEVDEFEGIEFCQTKPVFDGHNWIMCRKPLAIAKDCVMLHPYSRKYYEGWLHAVGTGGIRLAGGLPVFQEVYQLFRRSGNKTNIDYSGHVGYNMSEALGNITREYQHEILPSCRASFYFAFGVTPDEQLCLERHYRGGNLCRDLGEWRPRSIMGSVY